MHVPLSEDAVLPPLYCSTETDEARLRVYLADALFDPADVAEVERAGVLDVLVLEVAGGGASDNLPAAYEALYKEA